jgi:FkbM family methyltransferase
MKLLVTLLASGKLNYIIESYKSAVNQNKVTGISYDICIIINTLNESFYVDAFKYFQDKPVQFLRSESNGCPGKGHNSVIQNCKNYQNDYDYFLNIDGDDFLYPTALERLSKYLEYSPDALFLCFHDQIFTKLHEKNSNVPRINYDNGLLMYNITSSCSVQWFKDKGVNPFENNINSLNTPGRIILLGKNALNEQLKYDEDVSLYDDYITFMQLFELHVLRKLKVFGIFDSEIYLYNRLNDESATEKYNKEKSQQEEIVFRKSIQDRFLAIKSWDLNKLNFLRLDQTLFYFKKEYGHNLLKSLGFPKLEKPIPENKLFANIAQERNIADMKRLYAPVHPLNNFFEHIFVVNMKNDIIKKEQMIQKLSKLGIKFSFVEGIDGKAHMNIYKKYLDKPLDQKHQWETERNHQMICSPGAMGLLLTWENLLQYAIHNKFKNFLVFEDDCIFHEDFNQRVQPFLNIATTGEKPWEILMLGSKDSAAPTQEIQGQGYYKGSVNSAANHAIGVNNNIFEKYLQLCKQRIVPCDFTDFDKGVAYPNLVTQDDRESSIQIVKNKAEKLNVYVPIFAGLGNQMWQIASAYGIAKKHNYNLQILDTKSNKHNSNKIDYFDSIFSSFKSNKINHIPANLDAYNLHQQLYGEPKECFEYKQIDNPSKHISLQGYYQNPKYFDHCKHEIIELFKNEKCIKEIKTKYTDLDKSMFIHIRRGDTVNETWKELNYEKYLSNSLYLIQNKENIKFYVCSDDIEYCKTIEVLQNINTTFVQELDEIQTMYLMSLCKLGGICSNSTFAWWGSFLNTNSDKQVYMPKKWMNIDLDFSDTFYNEVTKVEDFNNLLDNTTIHSLTKYISDKNKDFIIFDIGSRDCLQSIELYKTFPNSRIYAFECNPNTINLCKTNIIPYSDRITLIQGAVCDYNGEITFYPINQEKTETSWKDGNPGASSIFKSNGRYSIETYVQDTIVTNCHRLDTVMKTYDIPKVDIIWMDLQGAELLALKSLGNYINNVRYIHTEVSHREIYTGQVMFDKLNDFMLSNTFSIMNKLTLQGWQEDVVYKKTCIDSLLFDIVIPVGPNDKNIIKKQILHTKENVIGYRNIYLICYDQTIQIEGCITINENVFPFSMNTVSKFHGKQERNGWYLQQLLKLYSGIIIPNILDKYLVIDSDTFFLKQTIFIKNNKCLYNFGTEYNKPYFTHMKSLHKDFLKVDRDKSGICHHMMFDTKYIQEIMLKVETKHNDKFYNIFLKHVTDIKGSGASEYELYFNYMLKYHQTEIELRKLNWENTTSLNNENDYDYISYHWYMRKNHINTLPNICIKKSLKLAYINFWNGMEHFYLTDFITHHFDNVTIVDNTDTDIDIMICSVFGDINNIKKLSAKVKLFFSGENLNNYPQYNNIKTLQNCFDIIVGFDKTDEINKQFRFPLWLTMYNYYECGSDDNILTYIENKHAYYKEKEKKYFASLIANHDTGGQRKKILNELEKYGKIYCPSKFNNNCSFDIGHPIRDRMKKIDFISKCVFNICSENSTRPGYCTEKLFDAFEAGTIPIYWGDLSEDECILNSNKYINCDLHNLQFKNIVKNKETYYNGNVFTKDAKIIVQKYYIDLKNALDKYIT